MFVIPCKFDRKNPIIFECVDAIKRHHPKSAICVVDSNSDDKSYYNELDKSIIVFDAKNTNFCLEAYKIAFDNFPNIDFFYNIHDSLILQKNISFVETNDLTTVRYWSDPPVDIGLDYDGSSLSIWANSQMRRHLGYSMPDSYYGVFGPMFMCTSKVMKQLSDSGFFNIKPKSKYQSCATERICGVVLSNLGYDVKNSLQGYGGDIFGQYDETNVKKVHLSRM